jgi:MFS family permease
VAAVRLGLRENLAQFSLLVAVNAFVGGMVGLERSTLPLIGEDEFGLTSSAAVLSFIVAFGLAKSFTNLAAGVGAERLGRRRLLIAGWLAALPVPVLIAIAPTWGWIVAANLLLGINQGLAWSMTVVMKIDLVGPRQRGFALGLNEAAGYGGVALAAALSGWLAAEYVARDVLVVGGAVIAVGALLLSAAFVRDTAGHVRLEQETSHHDSDEALRVSEPPSPTPRSVGRRSGRARRPGWSTTSTTHWHGGWSRSSLPQTAPRRGRSASWRGSTLPSGAWARSSLGDGRTGSGASR